MFYDVTETSVEILATRFGFGIRRAHELRAATAVHDKSESVHRFLSSDDDVTVGDG